MATSSTNVTNAGQETDYSKTKKEIQQHLQGVINKRKPTKGWGVSNEARSPECTAERARQPKQQALEPASEHPKSWKCPGVDSRHPSKRGGCLVPSRHGTIQESDRLRALVAKHGVTRFKRVNSMSPTSQKKQRRQSQQRGLAFCLLACSYV
ncbi:hypothetical protein CB1_000909004 [Camelus ferus]|nr:hypothetical protein CB1_000909004 [Camelus ferus]